MKTRLLFFGATADAVGKREIGFDFAEGSTIDEVLEKVKQENPSLGNQKLLVALNEEYVSLDTSVRDGDTLAVFTAVSGG